MIVTTTSFIPNTEISEIVDVIHSRVVVGTNVFSDISASFSDFFGGNNSSYEKRLGEITENAIDGLKTKAAKIKANAIIDLKIDVDEVSGKNKSMFMVTAIGTAVIAVTLNEQKNKTLSKEHLFIKGKDVDIEIQKYKIKKQLEENPSKELDEKEWEFIIDNRVIEFCYELLSCCVEWRKFNGTINHSFYDEKVKNYLFALPEEEVNNILYCLYFDDKYSDFDNIIFGVLKNKKIIDKKRIKELIENIDRDHKLKYKLLAAVRLREELINIEDLEDYKALYDTIKTKFIEVVSYGKQKKMFSSAEEEIWICTCSTKNKVELEFCHSCSKDKFGFYAGGVTPPMALEWLNDTIAYIENIKNNKNILKN